jgi:hypothetical protein
MLKKLTVTYQDEERKVYVMYTRKKGAKSSNPEVVPDDPLEIKVVKIFLIKDGPSLDITDEISNKEFERIENILYEQEG